MSLIHDRDTMEDFEEDAVEGRGKRRREMGYVSEAVRKQFLRIAAERESEIHRCDPKKIVTEALNDMDRVLDVTGVSKELKSTLCVPLKRLPVEPEERSYIWRRKRKNKPEEVTRGMG